MPPKCKAPKCAEVANKCACPNPWTEFLSKNAHKGKTTMAQHSAAYKALKDTGAFEPKAGMNNGGCKSDPVKLCAWKLRRKAGHKDLVAPVAGRATARNDRILRRGVDAVRPRDENLVLGGGIAAIYKEAGLNHKAIAYDEDGTNMSKEKELLGKYAATFGLEKKGLTLSKFIGRGDFGAVFEGTLKTSTGVKQVAVKFMPSDVSESDHIALEVHNHKMMHAALPHRVPKFYKAFKIKGKVSDEEGVLEEPEAHFPHVIVMDKVTPLKPIVWPMVMKQARQDLKLQNHICKDVLKLLYELRDKKLIHGDFDFRNLGYKMVNGKLRVYMLDFMSCWKTHLKDLDNDYFELTKPDPVKKMMEAVGGFPPTPPGPEGDGGYSVWRKSIKLPKIPF